MATSRKVLRRKGSITSLLEESEAPPNVLVQILTDEFIDLANARLQYCITTSSPVRNGIIYKRENNF
jgi:hypothetical protein